jgi:hypothetical protein
VIAAMKYKFEVRILRRFSDRATALPKFCLSTSLSGIILTARKMYYWI